MPEASPAFPGTAALARRLKALRTHPAVQAGPAAALAPGSVLLLAALLLGLVGAVWLGWGAGTPDAGATTAVETTSGALPAGEAREELDGLEEAGATRSRQAIDPRAATAVLVATHPAPAAGELRVHVVDARGAHVHEGELRLEPDSLSASAAVFRLLMREDLARFAELLDPIPLASKNPFEVRDLPAELLLLELRASAIVPGFGTPEPVQFRITADAPCELRLVLPEPRTVLVGVIDRETNAPIEGAGVLSVTELDRRDADAGLALESGSIGAARSDAAGVATLAGLGAGAHTLEVHAHGYARATVERDAQRERVDAALARAPATATLGVDVVDGAHYGMPGIEVVAKASGRALERRAVSDEWGRVVFAGLEPGHWSVAIEGLEFARACAGKDWNTRDLRVYAAFDLQPGERRSEVLGFQFGTATWAVRVVDAGGAPVRDAAVELNGPSQRALRTNASGWATFDELPVGRWRLELDGWTHVERDLAHHVDVRDTIGRGIGTLEGRVCDAEGRSVRGAWVMARHVPSGARASTRSGASGEFQLLHVPAGACELDAAAPPGSSGSLSVAATAGVVRDLVLRLQPPAPAK